MRIYKIYINEKLLLISTSQEYLSDYANLLILKGNKKSILNKVISELDKNELNTIGLLLDSEQAIESLLENNFKIIEAAGGIIYNKKEELLFIYRKGKWDLPKGKIDENEDKETAAIREVEEECGIQITTIQKELNPSYHIYNHKGQLILKKVYWFIMKYDGKELGKPQLEEDITDLKWLQQKDWGIVLSNTYPSIRDIILSELI